MSPQPPITVSEMERLAALRGLNVLDSEPEPLFDAITRLASEVCGVPVARADAHLYQAKAAGRGRQAGG